MTAVLVVVVGFAVGVVVGLRVKHRRFLLVCEQLRDATQRISAWKVADTKGDLDVVGPVTGPTQTVELFDQDALAEMRGHHITVGRRALHDWLTWCSCGWEAESTKQSEANELAATHCHQVDHLGQACGWSDDGTTACGEPAVGWGYHANGERVWLCDGHYRWACHGADDDPASTLPRSLPGRER